MYGHSYAGITFIMITLALKSGNLSPSVCVFVGVFFVVGGGGLFVFLFQKCFDYSGSCYAYFRVNLSFSASWIFFFKICLFECQRF